MLNTVGLLVKLATAFAVASHLIDLTLFLDFSGFISLHGSTKQLLYLYFEEIMLQCFLYCL
jgi:hypothetical protein